MSETTYLKLFKHDNPSTNENQFDVDKSLNDNWDKLDDFAGDVNEKVQEIEGNITKQEQDITYVKEELETEINELQKDIQANSIIEETEQAKSLYIDDATDSRGKIKVEGNVEQETSLYNGALEQGSLSASGTDVDASNRIRTADYIEVKENTEIKVLADGANQYLLAFFSTSKEYMSGSDWTNLGTGITIIASAKYAKVILRKTDNSTINVADISNFVVGDTPSIDYLSKIATLGSNKNLFNKKTTTDNMQINTNGSITPIPDVMCSDFIEVKEGKYYTLSGRTSYENFRKYDNDKNFLGTITAKNNGTVLISEGCKYIRFNALMKNKDKIKLEEGETATSYSPHGQGSTEINVVNKNLAEKIDGMWYSGSTKILYADAQGYGYIAKIKENSKITISKKNAGNRFVVCLTKEKPVANMSCDITEFPDATIRTEYSFNNTDYKYLFFGYYRGTDTEEAKKAGENVQIEIGDKTDYEEHKEQKIVLDIQQEMLTGDYFDLDRKKEVHGWNKKILTGTENAWQLYTTGTRRFGLDITGDLPQIITGKYGTGYCTHFKVLTTTGTDLTMFLQIEPNHFYIAIVDINSRWADVTALKSELQELYNAGTPITVFYKAAETTELDLTEAQIKALEQLNKLRFYKGVNNIMTTEDIALLQAEYSVNLKSADEKMQKQIDEIKELLSTTQTSATLLDNLEKDLIEEVK